MLTPLHLTLTRLLLRCYFVYSLQGGLSSVNETIDSLTEVSDSVCHLFQHVEQLSDFKWELGDIHSNLLSFDLEETIELSTLQMEVEKGIFDSSLISRSLHVQTHLSSFRRQGSELPKLDVPMFEGSLLNRKSFWEQFKISVRYSEPL